MKVKRLILVMLSFLLAGTLFFGCSSTNQTPDKDPDEGSSDNPIDNPIDNPSDNPSDNPDSGESVTTVSHKIFLAGDSTVKTYEDNQYIGGWGQYLSEFLGENLTVVNCAQGGRSSRSFINEGRLYDIDGCDYSFTQNNGNSIGDDISEGDYLFIQFGHNDDDTKLDASASTNYTTIYDRMVPLGEPVDGIYPTTPATKVSTTTLPALYTQYATDAEETKALAETAKYGSEYYSYESGGTYKWYLKQYIDFAREKGAIPVLVTPVARVKFSGNEIVGGPGLHGENFAYVQAVRQLAEEEDCLLIDLFADTKNILETATSTYANYLIALKPNDLTGEWPSGYDTTYGNGSLGYTGIEATHYNKYGAFITAAKVAENIISMNGETHNGGKEYFDFVSSVSNPKTYVDPSNLMSKTAVAAVEELFKTVNVTNPDRQYPDPAEVVNMISAISANTVTQDNYEQIGEECEAAREAYNNLNVDDRSAVTNYNDLVAAETAVAQFVEANRVSPVKVIRFDPSTMEVATITSSVVCAGLVDVGEDTSPTQFTIVGASGKAVDVKSGSASFNYSGTDYSVSKYVSMGGSASFSASRYIEFSVEGACKITVVAKSTGSDNRTLNLVDSSNAAVTSFAANTSQSITTQDITSAGTYKLGSAGSGIYVYAIIIEYFA
ncbi:MAG: GDSL-type esterase/lipase family protein [Candidatus Coproplasma sp.]